jgi:hypothetical protein
MGPFLYTCREIDHLNSDAALPKYLWYYQGQWDSNGHGDSWRFKIQFLDPNSLQTQGVRQKPLSGETLAILSALFG